MRRAIPACMGERRKKLSGMVDPKTYAAWHGFARSRGVTLTALLEALGRRLDTLDQPDARLPPVIRDAVKEARDVGWQRERRAPTDDDDRRRR